MSKAIIIPAITISALASSLYYIRQKNSSKWINLQDKKFQSETIPSDLDGKVILITGANTGLGYNVAKDLAKRNATVVIACRSIEKGTRAASQIVKETGNKNVSCLPLDLGDLESVEAFSILFSAKYTQIYAVICNAGVWVPMEEKRKTKQGFEIHFGVNHLGHFALIKRLIPFLERSGIQSRIVFVSSSLSKMGKIDMKKLDFVHEGRQFEAATSEKGKKKKFVPTGYADSKLMNALICKYLAKSNEGKGNLSFYSVSPGWCKTELGRDVPMNAFQKFCFIPIGFMFQRSGSQGAQNILHVTLEDDKVLVNGGFYQDGVIGEEISKHVDDYVIQKVDKKLWDLSEDLLSKAESK